MIYLCTAKHPQQQQKLILRASSGYDWTNFSLLTLALQMRTCHHVALKLHNCTSFTHHLLFSFSMSPPICLFDVNSTKSQRNPSAFFAPYHPVAYTFPAWRYLRTSSEDLTPLALAHFTPWASSTPYSRNSTHGTGFVSRGSKIWQLQMHINYAIRSNMKNVKLDFGFKLLVWRCIA